MDRNTNPLVGITVPKYVNVTMYLAVCSYSAALNITHATYSLSHTHTFWYLKKGVTQQKVMWQEMTSQALFEPSSSDQLGYMKLRLRYSMY